MYLDVMCEGLFCVGGARECGEDVSGEMPRPAFLWWERPSGEPRRNMAPAPWREPVPACLPAEPKASRETPASLRQGCAQWGLSLS